MSAAAPDSRRLVSLHLPKTAGTSFGIALAHHYGDALLEDYAMLPLQVPRIRREVATIAAGWRLRAALPSSVRCFHGHFLPLKYRIALGRGNADFVAWLREPVARLLSHYHFWRRDYAGSDPAQPLRNRMIAEDWSLERFCLGPELRNIYRQYLWGFRPDWFAFIGIAEHYAEDLRRFGARFLHGQLPHASALVNPDRGDRYDISSGLRQRIERHHALDVGLYRWALLRRARGPG